MATYTEQVNQYRYSTAALAAQMNDPRLRKLVDVVSRSIHGRSIDELPQGTQQVVMQLAMAAQNSLGMENGGAQYESIFRGVARAGAIPVGAGFGSGRASYGRSYGIGNNTIAVASSLSSALMQGIRGKGGGIDYGMTNGLGAGTMAQLAGQYIGDRRWESGDVFAADFGSSAKDFQTAIVDIERTSGLSRNSKEIKQLREALRARERYDELKATYKGNEAAFEMAWEGETKYSEEAKQMAERQARGSLTGTYVSKELKDDVQAAIKATSANVKELSEIFGTDDFAQLQQAASSLNMGSLADTRRIRAVKGRIDNAKVHAAMTGRQVAEVLNEQAQLIAGAGGVFGGAAFVPAHAVERLQRVSERAREEGSRGESWSTVEERQGQAIRSEANAAEMFKGVAMVDYLINTTGDTLPPELLAQAKELRAEFLRATNERDRDAQKRIAAEAYKLARVITPVADDITFQRAALAGSTIDLAEASVMTAAPTVFNRAIDRHWARSNGGGRLAIIARDLGDDASGTKTKALFDSSVRLFGGNQADSRAAMDEAGKWSKMSEQSRREAYERYKKDTIGEGMAVADAERLANFILNASKLSDQARKAVAAQHSEIAKTNPTLMQASSLQEQARREKVALKLFVDEAAKRDKAVGKDNGMLGGFIAGIMGDTGFTDAQAADAHLRKLKKMSPNKSMKQLADENGYFHLGELTEGGVLANREELLKNKEFLATIGVDANNEQEMRALRESLNTVAGTNAVIKNLETAGHVTSLVNGELVAMEASKAQAANEEFKEVAQRSGLAGLEGIFDSKDLVYTRNNKGEDVIRVASKKDPGKNLTVSKALKERIKDLTPEQLARLEEVSANGNKHAKEALGLVYSDMGAAVKRAFGERTEGEWFGLSWTSSDEFAQKMGYSSYREVQKKIDNYVKNRDVNGLRDMIKENYGTDDLSVYDSEQSLRGAGLIDADGKINAGKFKGFHFKDVLAHMNGEGKGADNRRDIQALLQQMEELKAQDAQNKKLAGDVSTLAQLATTSGLKVKHMR